MGIYISILIKRNGESIMGDKKYRGKNNFVPEYFLWIEPDEQKRRAEELNKMTKKRKSKKNEEN